MKDFLKGNTPESITRLAFFIIVLALVVWESYAVFNKSIVPHIEVILAFTAGILVNKQYQERVSNANTPPTV